MKKLGVIIFLALSTNLVAAQYGDAGEYLDAIGQQYRLIQEQMWDYTSASAHGKNAKTVEKKRITLIQTTLDAKKGVRGMKGFQENTTYRDSVVAFLNIYYLVLREDYAKIVDMEEIAEQSYDLMEAYMLAKEEASKKLNEASDMLSSEQKKFAEEFDVELLAADDELNTKMKIAEEVYGYYNDIYLIFFKSYVADIYLSDAIEKGDISAIEQQKNALSSASEEGLNALKGLKPFKGDNSLIVACRGILSFYQDEADNQIQHITNFFIKSENFNTIKASFEQKKDNDKTQDDIDAYNNAVNEANDATEKFNSTNKYIFEGRGAKINAWNDGVLKFTDKHVPKK
jgi:hypothetical protein